tara:strand:- start:17606 stop:18082 length:477 start_codon:yes stop_codon:yes gene_type:complete
MLYLGTNAKVLYEAKNQRTGLTDVEAFVTKPDGSALLPIALSELGTGVLSGFYLLEIPTSDSDPEGDWIIIINSPTEGHKTKAVRSFVARPESGGVTKTIIVNTPDRLISKTRSGMCSVRLVDHGPLKVMIRDDDAKASLQDSQLNQKINDQQQEVRT